MPQTSTPTRPRRMQTAHMFCGSWLFAVASGRMQRAKSTRCFWIIICQADKDKSSLERFQHTLSEATLGDSFWIHLVFLKSFCDSRDIQGMLHWNSFQSYCFDPWSGCCSGLPGTFWLCRWSAKWVVVAGFGVDVLLVSNWLDVFANIGTESSIAIRNPSHHKIPTFVDTFQVTSPACLGFTLWCPDFQNGFCFKVLRIFGGHRAPKRQWTSQPVSGSSWRRGKHSRGSQSAAQRSVSLDFNVGVRSLSAGSHARIEC